jgi:hypothetical protein
MSASRAIDFSPQEWKEDLARYKKRKKAYRGLPEAEHARFDALRAKYLPLLLEYPEELPTEEHRESALHVIYRAFYGSTPWSSNMPSYSGRLYGFLISETNRERGFIF